MSDPNRDFFDPKKRVYPACLAGYFLISELELADPNFTRTVVLVISHDEQGAFGLVVNRPAQAGLGDILADYEEPPAAGIPVFVGGPVEQQFVFILHGGLPDRSEHSREVVPGVIFEPAFDTVGEYLKTDWGRLETRPPVHLFAGYSGWSPGQLESELAEGAWLVKPAESTLVFHPDPQAAWHDAFGSLGEMFRIAAETGHRPSLN